MAGSGAQQPLVRLDPEPEGEHCVTGGTAVNAGLDSNGNGTLEDSEVTSTSYVCNPTGGGSATVMGSFTIRNSLDVALLAGVTHITGDLVIDAPGLQTVSVPSIATIDGKLIIAENPTLTSAALPALATVGGINVSGNLALTTFSLPALTTSDDIDVYANGVLATVSLPVLASAGRIALTGDAMLTTVDLGMLATADQLDLQYLALTAVSLPKLTATEQASFYTLSELTTVDMPLFATGGLTLANVPELVDVNVPKLKTPSQLVIDNTGLTTLDDFGAVTSVGPGSFAITSNAALTDASALASSITTTVFTNVSSNPELTSIAFPLLTATGDVYFEGGAVTQLSLPALVTTKNLSVSYNTALTSLALPELTTVTGGLAVMFNPALTSVSAPKLASGLENIVMIDNAAGLSVNLDGLTSIGCTLVLDYFDLGCTPKASKSVAGQVRIGAYAQTLGTISLAGLTEAHAVSVEGVVGSLALGNLASVTTAMTFQYATTMTSLSLPKLTTVGSLNIDHMSLLTSLTMPLLTNAGSSFQVNYNPKLPSCLVEQIYNQLSPTPNFSDRSNNDTTATCP